MKKIFLSLLAAFFFIAGCSEEQIEETNDLINIDIPSTYSLNINNARIDEEIVVENYLVIYTIGGVQKEALIEVSGIDGSDKLSNLKFENVLLKDLGINPNFWANQLMHNSNGRIEASGCDSCSETNKKGKIKFKCAVKCTLEDLQEVLSDVADAAADVAEIISTFGG